VLRQILGNGIPIRWLTPSVRVLLVVLGAGVSLATAKMLILWFPVLRDPILAALLLVAMGGGGNILGFVISGRSERAAARRERHRLKSIKTAEAGRASREAARDALLSDATFGVSVAAFMLGVSWATSTEWGVQEAMGLPSHLPTQLSAAGSIGFASYSIGVCVSALLRMPGWRLMAVLATSVAGSWAIYRVIPNLAGIGWVDDAGSWLSLLAVANGCLAWRPALRKAVAEELPTPRPCDDEGWEVGDQFVVLEDYPDKTDLLMGDILALYEKRDAPPHQFFLVRRNDGSRPRLAVYPWFVGSLVQKAESRVLPMPVVEREFLKIADSTEWRCTAAFHDEVVLVRGYLASPKATDEVRVSKTKLLDEYCVGPDLR